MSSSDKLNLHLKYKKITNKHKHEYIDIDIYSLPK
jgi:hypothetical protein